MGNVLKKVQSGDPLWIPGATFNTPALRSLGEEGFIDAPRDFQARQRHVGQAATPQFRQAGVVLVRNDSGADRARFDILGIKAPIFTPADSEDAAARCS